ncbi:2-succinyl-5-enolpyruvyl-6-hydroxy-3-cyclohexene-1-carboxylic-acid synthase [Alkalibacillus salilacus]|uniref:2-succinyl-5-enolpyruvyl-6-hydroxy-3-cyclohexene-1-carboxylate synthase n=1 Tax=Alkalibacillus salilacus TaxID=284582 RepID=A0ABT9VJ23_9BACI|nr:2-succinyl-5-enolpyruvyl-6-hydroxy-3-cyclohexene-1-carboxylic-acid synthase [Alkalibacillus salilacus]MDQ0160850.1 2-succinyl-5-enolpyruvyl-6-hydroxy-3-cyclohexene-1-carboxylate synthase [Alkalibacillus salilacus]
MTTMGNNTYYVSYFIDELYQSGLDHVVITPGSRSTPLSMVVAHHPSIQDWIHFDERSAAFFALGIAKATQKPVALVCTSGTAAANYYPAIVEAYYSRVPLIVLTADRPQELRDNGAPQAIDQVKMYGDYVKHFHDMAVADATPSLLQYCRRQASRAFALANSNRKGPVQFNFPFRDPLTPDLSLDHLWGSVQTPYVSAVGGHEELLVNEAELIASELAGKQKGLIMCGELTSDEEARAVLELARQWNIPVLADPLSRLRQMGGLDGLIISTYDALLKQEAFQQSVEPDFVVRFGPMPVSKAYFQWMAKVAPSTHIVVDQQTGYREHSNIRTTMVYSDITAFVHQASQFKIEQDPEWTKQWIELDQRVQQTLTEMANESLTEGSVAHVLAESVADGETIFVGSSMPIRDIDTFFLPKNKQVKVLANRGANGIDGVISSAMGVAASGEHVTLLIGDLSLLHDFTSLLMAKKQQLALRIVVINNNGGGIFNFLPQYQHGHHFEKLFGTPFDAPIGDMVSSLDIPYQCVESNDEFTEKVNKPVDQLEVIEVQTEREDNFMWHQQIKSNIESLLDT